MINPGEGERIIYDFLTTQIELLVLLAVVTALGVLAHWMKIADPILLVSGGLRAGTLAQR